jgi:hypothetical protein
VGKVQKYRLLEQLQQELVISHTGDNSKYSKTEIPTGLFKQVTISGNVTAGAGTEAV